MPPMSVVVEMHKSIGPLSIEQVSEEISLVRWTSCHCPSCVGRGWRCENTARKDASPSGVEGYSSNDRNGKSPRRFDVPFICPTSCGPRRVCRCRTASAQRICSATYDCDFDQADFLVFHNTVAELSEPNHEFSPAMLLWRRFSAVRSTAKFAANSRLLMETFPVLKSVVMLSGNSRRHTVEGSHSRMGKITPPIPCRHVSVYL
jgi:hypothetical protein